MTWEPFVPASPGLFGEQPDAPPAKVWRGALADFDNPLGAPGRPAQTAVGFSAHLGLRQLEAVMGGKVLQVPRLEGWWGDRPYRFGGRVVQPQARALPEVLDELLLVVEGRCEQGFDSCFANYYRNERDCIAWHADDEPWIGPVIASVSFGSTRRFWLRRKADHSVVVRGHLEHGDLLMMEAGCQDAWEHSVPRETRPCGPRLNLTFRQTHPRRRP